MKLDFTPSPPKVAKYPITEEQDLMLGTLRCCTGFQRQFAVNVLNAGAISAKQAALLRIMFNQMFGTGKHCTTQCTGEHEATCSDY